MTRAVHKASVITAVLLASLLLAVLASAFFDLESQSGQEDAHLMYNAARRASVISQPYYVAAPDHKGPLWIGAYSTALRIARDGNHFWFVISAFCILLAVATVLCAWRLASLFGTARILSAAVALSALVYLLLGSEDYTKVLFARNLSSFLTVASIAVLSFLPGKTYAQTLILIVVSACFLGLAVQTVLSVAIVSPIVAAFLIYFLSRSQHRATRLLIMYISCSLIVCFSAAAWYYFHGVFNDFWITWWTYNTFYVESKIAGPLLTVKRILIGYYFYYRLHPVFALIVLAFFLHIFGRKNSEERRLDILLFGWFLLEAIAVAATQRFFENYMIQIYVPMVVMAIALAARFGAKRETNTQAYLGIAISLLVLFTLAFNRFSEGIGYLSDFAKRGITSTSDRHLKDLTPGERALRAFVQKSTGPDDYIYIWSSHPQLYSAVDRVAAVRYLRNSWLIGRIHGGGGIHKEYVLPVFWQNWKKDLHQTTPVLIVLLREDPPAPDSPLISLLHCGYKPVWNNSEFEVWKFTGNRACLSIAIPSSR